MLKIKNAIITASIPEILSQLKLEVNKDLFRSIQDRGNNIRVTCPFHSNGQEKHPSCEIYCGDNESLEYGTFHCFTCKRTGSLASIVSHCFDENSEEFGKEWLHQRFGDVFIQYKKYLPKIELNKTKNFLDPKILDEFEYYNDYMFTRKLSKDVINKYRVGFDKKLNMICFPVWDIHNNLVMITKRSVDSKVFLIDENKEKPVYLLNFVLAEGHKTVYIAESQINALTLQSWGYPAVALIGTGSANQYKILSRSGIRNYILCFDGDQAGDEGRNKFKLKMPSDVLISYKKLPRGKDVNDLTKEEFENLDLIDI